MPTYFFHIDDEGVDAVGTACATLADVEREAIVRAGEIMAEEPEAFCTKAEWGMTVSDPAGRPVFALSIRVTHAPSAGYVRTDAVAAARDD